MEKRVMPDEIGMQRQQPPQYYFLMKEFELLKTEFAKTQKQLLLRDQEIPLLKQEVNELNERVNERIRERDEKLTQTMRLMLEKHIQDSRPWWRKLLKK